MIAGKLCFACIDVATTGKSSAFLVSWRSLPNPQIDTFASVFGMLRIAIPAGVKQEGLDFSPLLRGQKIPWRDAIFGQYDLHNLGLAYMRMIRTGNWKLVRHHHANELDELYDLQNDPGETRNLYNDAQHRTTREELQRKLTAWQQRINDPLLR